MHFSENSRVWIYQADRELLPQEHEAISEQLQAFTKQWEAHGKVLKAGFELRYNRFIVIIVDENQAPATGCSIDKSVALLKSLEQEFDLNLFDRLQLAYRSGNNIEVCSKAAFEQKIASGELHAESIVFNNLVQNYADYLQAWEVPAKKSWHARLLTSEKFN